MRDEVGMCGPEQRDRLGDGGRPTRYLRVEGRGLSTALLMDTDGRRIGIVDVRYADLLAAAPELLDVIKKLVNHADNGESLSHWWRGWNDIRATIAKAEGR